MPLRAKLPIVRVEHGSMHTIETRNPENLFGLWSVFSKCSPAMEDGKRYENMAWRLWARETFCCQPDHVVQPQWSFDQQVAAGTTVEVPELSTSVASDDSIDPLTTSQHRSDSSASRPDLRRHDSATSNARGKHMTPIDLEKVVHSIQEKKALEPMSPLPPHLAPQTTQERRPEEAIVPRSASPPLTARRCAPELSTSTFATARGSDDLSATGSEASTSTDVSQHSVVRGFEPGHISTSIRSSTNLAPTPSILKKTSSFIVKPPPSRAEPMIKKKQPMFTLGGSSDEDASSSLEAYSLAQRSSLSENLRKAGSMNKTTSFANQISLRQYQEAISESEGAIESDSDEPDESAIEEEDSGDDWEDDDEEADESHQSSMQTSSMFPRVDSKPNLTSHRSLLTTMMHEGDRAQAMQNAAQRQQPPPIRRSRTTTPNGPSIGNSPQEDSGLMMRQQASRAKPIIMTTSNVHPPALSPRTTRRLMLQNELSGSLRQNLLWERQQKNATTNAAMRRAATTTDLQGMTTMAQAQPMHTSAKNPNSYFDQGLGSYHTKGW
ncbi:hypothetical protein E8E12_003027 [Didymella heteroderae]|uniref:Nitrogen regulatory protein areA GATA-like domain-containing protein n=1 Tax=Didymella heteroderae TaxID=1769908 RepID=A0A9P4WGU7_9PLEO|nr:hypothetical protein E8E12_003027 [Didymella heteroderae]